MASTPDSFKTWSFSYEELLEKAQRYKEDLEKGNWEVARKEPNSTYWIKTFPDEEIPVKILFERKLTISAKQFADVYSPEYMEYRPKWDKVFHDNEILEEYPDNGGYLIYTRIPVSWPLSDRDFVLFIPPFREIEWCGKRSYLTSCKNASHQSKPANEGYYVRATNGGNFYISIPDEEDPENACTLFGMTTNNYNGWLPNYHVQWLLKRRVPPAFDKLYDCVVEGHKMFFANK